MKHTILKATLMAVVALTLMAGSAFAAQINGTVGFGGTFTGLCTEGACNIGDNSLSMYAIVWSDNAKYPNTPDGSRGYLVSSTTTPTEDFKDYLPPDGGWNGQYYQLPNWPNPVWTGFQFKEYFEDDDTGALTLGDWLYNIAGLSGEGDDGFVWGTIEGFTFVITNVNAELSDIGLSSDGKFGLWLDMEGYVYGNGYEKTLASFMFSAQVSSVSNKDWYYTFDVITKPGEVPEPGTLVLLGTGLLGAAIVARRKVAKK